MAEREDGKSLRELQEENLRIQNEHLREQTEFYREQNAVARAARESALRMHAVQEETLALNRATDAAMMRQCNHRKGGKGDDLINKRGNDPNYCVIKHQYPWGEWSVFCQRCAADWRPYHTEENHPTGISFRTAFQWPTDNSPSGAAQFLVPPERLAQLRRENLQAGSRDTE